MRKIKEIVFVLVSLGVLLVCVIMSTGCSTMMGAMEAAWEAGCDAKTRYQTPIERPYIVREVTIEGGATGVKLAGELTMPNGVGPFPGVVLISGSELANRDSFILGHKPFLVLADYLTRRGYVVYRHDDRGYGESTGDSYAALDVDFSADSAAALNWLRAQERVDARRVGFIGHSQGANKGAIAAKIEKPDFMIFLAGGVESTGGLLIRQARDISRSYGVPNEDLKKQEEHIRNINGILRSSETLPEGQRCIEKYALERGFSKKLAKLIVENSATPWRMAELKRGDDMYAELDAEIASLLKSYDRPILAVYGGKDLIVSSNFNAPRTDPLLINSQSKVLVFPAMNHFMQTVPQGRKRRFLEEVCDIEMTFDPNILNAIGEWLDEVTQN